jgi:quercetin dioxygenase-like cupin family protein
MVHLRELFGGEQILSTTAGQWAKKLIQFLKNLRARPPFVAVTAGSLEWSRNQRHQERVTYFMKPLFTDPKTGQAVMLIRYPAGQMNPSHSHPVGHGIYVLEGSLVTHRGTFGPNTFVWFPPGELMTHGASPDTDVVALFMAPPGCSTEYALPPLDTGVAGSALERATRVA